MNISLKAARVNKNLTQKEAAKLLGISNNMLSKWENGKAFPSTKRIPKITEVYGVKYDELIFLP